jgi:hypothetical protein
LRAVFIARTCQRVQFAGIGISPLGNYPSAEEITAVGQHCELAERSHGFVGSSFGCFRSERMNAGLPIELTESLRLFNYLGVRLPSVRCDEDVFRTTLLVLVRVQVSVNSSLYSPSRLPRALHSWCASVGSPCSPFHLVSKLPSHCRPAAVSAIPPSRQQALFAVGVL